MLDFWRRDCPQHQGGRSQIYNDQEAHTIGDVGKRIPHIYVVLDNGQVDHQASFIEMDNKICDLVASILIDHGSNCSYVNPNLVDKCGLNKEVHLESWLVQLDTSTKKIVHHWV